MPSTPLLVSRCLPFRCSRTYSLAILIVLGIIYPACDGDWDEWSRRVFGKLLLMFGYVIFVTDVKRDMIAGGRPRSPSTTLSRAFSSDLLYRSPVTSPLPGSPTHHSPYCTPPDEEHYAPLAAASANMCHPLPPPHPSTSCPALQHHPASLTSQAALASSSSLYQNGHLDHMPPAHSTGLAASRER